MGLGDTLGALPPECGGTGGTTYNRVPVEGTVQKVDNKTLRCTPPGGRHAGEFTWLVLGGPLSVETSEYALSPTTLPINGSVAVSLEAFSTGGYFGAYDVELSLVANSVVLSIPSGGQGSFYSLKLPKCFFM